MKRIIHFLFVLLMIASVAVAQEKPNKYVDITIRSGQGGFVDARSPIGKLGGGQLTLDIKLRWFPIALSFSGEYYTNSSDPTHAYEIAGLGAYNILYMNKLLGWERVNVFAGGGLGYLEVPKESALPIRKYESAIFYNMEAGINIRVLWKFGIYGIYKYLYAYKETDTQVIDFNEHIVLLGLTFNFSL